MKLKTQKMFLIPALLLFNSCAEPKVEKQFIYSKVPHQTILKRVKDCKITNYKIEQNKITLQLEDLKRAELTSKLKTDQIEFYVKQAIEFNSKFAPAPKQPEGTNFTNPFQELILKLKG